MELKNMNGYIYLNFADLSNEKQEELRELAREYVAGETTKEEAEDLRMTFDELVDERIENKMQGWNMQGKFIFNY